MSVLAALPEIPPAMPDLMTYSAERLSITLMALDTCKSEGSSREYCASGELGAGFRGMQKVFEVKESG